MPGNIIADIKNCYTESSSTFRELYDHMEKCHQYYNGKQFTSTDENTLTTTGNIKPELNLISKQVDSLIGKRITTLTDIKANPIEKDDLWISDLATRTLKWVIDNCNGQSHILRGHKDQILGGLGWVVVDLDMSKDFISGDINLKYEKYSNILIDPHTEDLLGLSDCDYIQRFRTLNKSDLKKLFPDKAAEIDALKADEADGSIFKRNTIQSERNQNVTVKEHWYRKFKTKTVIINLNDEEDQATWDRGAESLQIFLDENPNFKSVKVTEQIMCVATTANDTVILQDVETIFRRYPFIPFVGYYDSGEEDWRYKVRGYASQLIGLQDQILFFRGAILKCVRDFVQQVYYVEDGSLKNDDVEQIISKRGRAGLIRTKRGGNQGIRREEQSPIPQAYQGMELALRNDINVVGTPPELMGTPTNLESGKAIGLMQSVGLLHTGEINEHLNYALRSLGQLILEIAFANFTVKKFQRICGASFEMQEDLIAKAKDTIMYDIKVDETTNSPTYQIAAYESLQQQIQHGMPVPPETMIENNPYFNYEQKQQILQQYTQMQQQQQQAAMQQEQAKELGQIQSNAQIGAPQ
jgi:hypothetical protein